jgi:transcription termination factor NusB
MNEEEVKAYEFYRECNENDLSNFEYFSEPSKKQIEYMETLLNLIEKQQNRIDNLEKALVEEAIKSTEKINKAIKRIKETRLDYLVVGQEVLEILEGQV